MVKDDCDALFNTGAICAFLGCSKPTLYKWIKKGLPVTKEGPNQWLASKKAINTFFYLRSTDNKQ